MNAERWPALRVGAEGAGFEPAVRLHALWFSRPAHSTALPPLRGFAARCYYDLVRRSADAADQALDWPQTGEVAEWLKALAC